MFSMPILDVAIGLSFFYLLLGLICSTVNEMIASWLKTRARFLDLGIGRILAGDSELKHKLYQHHLIKSLAESDRAICPSYIPADKFATALLDILSGLDKPVSDMDAIRAGAQATNTDLQRSLKALIDASGDAAVLHQKIETWFNESMDRVSGWYKRNAHRNTLLLATGVTLVLNADTVNVSKTLWTSPTMRAAVVESAKQRTQEGELLPMVEYNDPQDSNKPNAVNVPTSPEEGLTAVEQQQLGQLTGWASDWTRLGAVQNKFAGAGGILWDHWIGWVLTIIAVSLGAPFWFDTLNRFMNIRNAGRSPDEPRDKANPQHTA
jgi:hypothetical protein